jgi:hypothetical protein
MAAGMSARRDIKHALTGIAAIFEARGVEVDGVFRRALRDYGVACYEMGHAAAHSARTIPIPPVSRDDEVTGRYQVEHPFFDEKGNDHE